MSKSLIVEKFTGKLVHTLGLGVIHGQSFKLQIQSDHLVLHRQILNFVLKVLK